MTDRRDARPGLRVFAPIITPFTSGGNIDEAAFRSHLGRLGRHGVGVYVAGPGSGEGNSLSRAEMQRLFAIAVEELSGRVPVRAMGVEPRSIDQMIGFMDLSAQAGMDAAYLYSLDMGHGIRPTTVEMEHYLTSVLSATQLPAVISVHDSAHYLYPIEVLERVVERFAVAGISVATTNFTYLTDLVARLCGKVEITVGNLPFVLPAAFLGAQATVMTEANVAPGLVASLVRQIAEADVTAAMDSYQKLARLSACVAAAGGQRSIKAVMQVAGQDSGRVRPPRLPVSADMMELLKESVAGMAFLADD